MAENAGNELENSVSLYLRQHADQEIAWRPWGKSAWAYAAQQQKPVFISIGYSSCHWCHVFSDESFCDSQIAQKINENFVAIKVDRDELAAVADYFRQVTQAITGVGGWPDSIFCTPEGKPFFAGTYFPPSPAPGIPSFAQVLDKLAEMWQTRRSEVHASAAELETQILAALPAFAITSREKLEKQTLIVEEELVEIRRQVAAEFDILHAGFGTEPKFPPAALIDALLVSGDPGELEMAKHTLEAMVRGGIHDQLGGGFHRYTLDQGWVVPHFEKMLYTNALLLGCFTRGYRRTPDHEPFARSLFASAAEGIISWLEGEMLTPSGAYAASLDADAADARGLAHEGIYYCWSPQLLANALTETEAEFARKAFQVTQNGTFDFGLSTLQLVGKPDAEQLEVVRKKLAAVRAERFAPERDETIIAHWNGLLIDSLVQAALIFGSQKALEMAQKAAKASWRLWQGEKLWRTAVSVPAQSQDAQKNSVPEAAARQSAPDVQQFIFGASGICADYAGLALGYARLAAASGERLWAERAEVLLDTAQKLFSDTQGGWFTAEELPPIPRRFAEIEDDEIPSATSTMIAALQLAGGLLGRGDFIERAQTARLSQAELLRQRPISAGWALELAIIDNEVRRGLGRALAVIVTEKSQPLNELSRAVWRMAPAGTVIVTVEAEKIGEWKLGEEQPFTCPSLKAGIEKPAVYLRRNGAWLQPVTKIDDLRELLWRRC